MIPGVRVKSVGFLWHPSIMSVSACTLACMAGCAGPPSSSTPGFALSDSAGITIATSETGSWGEGEGWHLAEAPDLEIGLVDGPEEYQLYRVGSGVRLGDGRMIIANTSTLELRYYDAEGHHLLSVGGDGDGPGEFRTLWPISLLGDSIFVFEKETEEEGTDAGTAVDET